MRRLLQRQTEDARMMEEGGVRRLALAVLRQAVRDYRRARKPLDRGNLRRWVSSIEGEFYCDCADVLPGRVLSAMSKAKRRR
jgi:hypothetical protein